MKDIEYLFSLHLKDRMDQRAIKKEWIMNTINNFDEQKIISDTEVHFFKIIDSAENKCLKVVVNKTTKIIITAYFDRNKTKNYKNGDEIR